MPTNIHAFPPTGNFYCAATFIFSCSSCWSGQGQGHALHTRVGFVTSYQSQANYLAERYRSGSETPAQLLQSNHLTLMFCSFSGLPMILLIYGYAREITPKNREWCLFIPYTIQCQAVDKYLILKLCLFKIPLAQPCLYLTMSATRPSYINKQK